MNAGETAIGSAMKELEKTGYLFRERIRDEAGKYVALTYNVFAMPENNPHFKGVSEATAKQPKKLKAIHTVENHVVVTEALSYREEKRELIQTNTAPKKLLACEPVKLEPKPNTPQDETVLALEAVGVKRTVAAKIAQEHAPAIIRDVIRRTIAAPGITNRPGLIVATLNTTRKHLATEKAAQEKAQARILDETRKRNAEQETAKAEAERERAKYHAWKERNPKSSIREYAALFVETEPLPQCRAKLVENSGAMLATVPKADDREKHPRRARRKR